MDALTKRLWRGKVRELENLSERVIILSHSEAPTAPISDGMRRPVS
jgi:DNA-binding NtrC family response regulator